MPRNQSPICAEKSNVELNRFQVIGYDPITTEAEAAAAGIEKMELNEIWPLADYITVHTPLIPQTRNLISKESLAKSKRGVKVINVARGGIINEADLLEALQSGQCGGAAVDVYEEEPPKGEVTKALIQHPAVVATPHLGASTGKQKYIFLNVHARAWQLTVNAFIDPDNFLFAHVCCRRGSGSRCSRSGRTIYRSDWTFHRVHENRWRH